MEELDKYIEQIKEKIKELETTHESLTEEEIVMLVYIDLGKKLYFDTEVMFGDEKKKEEILINDSCLANLDKKFKSRKIICKTASKILEYILRNLGIKIDTIKKEGKDEKSAHTYNVIYPQNGSEPYRIDLQSDLQNIQFHTMTKDFGKSIDRHTYIILPQRQKEIHEKIGYITKENPYTEEYGYLIKSDVILMDDIYDKLDFVLSNIELGPNPSIRYYERACRHRRIMDLVFSKLEIKKLENQLHGVKCYKKDDNSERIYLNCYYINQRGKIYIYLYDNEEYSYKKYTTEEFEQKIEEEQIEISQETPIPRLKKHNK